MTNYKSPLGINLDGNIYYSYAYYFINLLKRGPGFRSDQGPLQFDASGYVMDLDPGQQAYMIFDDRTNYGEGTDGPFLGCRPANPYVLRYEGSGSLRIANAGFVSGSANRQVYNLSSGNVTLWIDSLDSSNYPRNISVVPLEYEHIDHIEEPFYPKFIETLSGGPNGISPRFSCIRFMTWLNTNGISSTEYHDTDIANNPPEGIVTHSFAWKQYATPLPYKILCKLCNKLKCDMWINIPAASSAERDVYVSSLAEFVRDNLDTDLKVYIEYSNETWNGIFMANQYTLTKAREMFGPGGDETSKRVKYHCYISNRISRIFKEVFANAGQENRVNGVLGVQSAGEWHVSAVALPYLAENNFSSIDSIAGAPYFAEEFIHIWQASSLMLETSSPTQIAREAYNQVISGISLSALVPSYNFNLGIPVNPGDAVLNSANQGQRYANHSRIRGLAQHCAASGYQYIAYEGGQHMVPKHPQLNDQYPTYMRVTISDLLKQANRDPYMGSATFEYLKGWNEETSGALFCYFTDVSPYSQYGYWGADDSFFFWGQSEKAKAVDRYISEYSTFEGPITGINYYTPMLSLGVT